MKEKRFRPRWLAHLRATIGGYFWLPCPLCGEEFGGFEWAGDLKDADGMGGRGVCANCVERAETINQKQKIRIIHP